MRLLLPLLLLRMPLISIIFIICNDLDIVIIIISL